MSDNKYMTAELKAEVSKCVDLLLTSAGKPRRRAAAALSRLGIWTRGSLLPRGDLGAPARNRLPEPKKLDDLLACLEDPDAEVRRQAALALGEWGDEGAAAAWLALRGATLPCGRQANFGFSLRLRTLLLSQREGPQT